MSYFTKKTITQFKSSLDWTKQEPLPTSLSGTYIEIIFRATEKWSETNGLQTLANHEITNIEYYPELFIVPSDFCQ